MLYSFSIPILTYASEVKRYLCSDMRDCHIAVNDTIQRVFKFNRWESIRSLRSLVIVTCTVAFEQKQPKVNVAKLNSYLKPGIKIKSFTPNRCYCY